MTNRSGTASLNGLTAVTVREAERAADQLLDDSWWTDDRRDRPLPVEPGDLARGLGIKVVVVPLRPDESGNIVIPELGTVVISLNQWDSLNRQRFTCAHEIGHYLRRADQPATRTFVDYRDTLAGYGVDADEIFANQFAAALLMPAHLVQRWHRQEGVDALARRFGTSTQAMKLRLRNLQLLSTRAEP